MENNRTSKPFNKSSFKTSKTNSIESDHTPDFRHSLRRILVDRMTKNPSYSLRAFARDLNISRSYLSLVINGKKQLSRKKSLIFSELLATKGDFLYPTEDPYHNLTEEKFQILNQWYHLPILELSLTKGFIPNTQWIAKRLKIKPAQAHEAIQRLESLGLIKEWKKQSRKLEFKTHAPHEAVRSFHQQMIQKALDSFQESKFENREISSSTMTFDPKRLPEIKKKIEKFRKDILDWLSKDDGTEVYQLNVQFFQLTSPSQK